MSWVRVPLVTLKKEAVSNETKRYSLYFGMTCMSYICGEWAQQKTWEEEILFTANVCDGGCKRLRGRLQTFAGTVANVCRKRGNALHSPRKYVQPSLQVRATVPASTCNRPRKYVRPSLQVRASEIEPKNIHTWQKVPHEHVVRDLPDSLSHGINPRCSLNHHLDCVEMIFARHSSSKLDLCSHLTITLTLSR